MRNGWRLVLAPWMSAFYKLENTQACGYIVMLGRLGGLQGLCGSRVEGQGLGASQLAGTS